jgi:YD repeat-containing protein
MAMNRRTRIGRQVGAGSLALLVWAAALPPHQAHAAQTVTYTYDAAGRLTGAAYDDSVETTFTYDPTGNLLSIVTEAVTADVPAEPGPGGLPSVFRLGPCVPNPIRRAVTLHYQIPRTSNVRLEVVEPGGRRVRTIIHGVLPAGVYSVGWDGRDGSGREVSSGVYFVRFQADGFAESHALTVLR